VIGRRVVLQLTLYVVTAAAVVVGCAGIKQTELHAQPPGQCTAGTPSPVSVRALVRSFGSRAIALRRWDICGFRAVAEVTNVQLGLTPKRQAAVIRRHGRIFCDLYTSSKWIRLQILTYAHGKALTAFYALNLNCWVYPSAPKRATQQAQSVERIMRTILRGNR
jgi:hypothetical protein